jgi:hypothetical protein
MPRLHDSQCHAQASQVANARSYKPLKLKRDHAGPKSQTKVRADDLSRHLNYPVAYMAFYKECYLYTMARTSKKGLDWDKDPAVLTPNAVRRPQYFSFK